MVNEKKMREQFALAMLDEHMTPAMKRADKRFRFDYIWLQMLVSLITGSLCFALLALLLGLWNMDSLLEQINDLDYVGMLISMAAWYAAFMIVYLFATLVWSFVKYSDDRRTRREYNHHLQKLRQLYRRE